MFLARDSFDGGGLGFAAFAFEIAGKLDDQDGVLAGEADEDEEADLGEDVVFTAREPHAGDCREQAHRHDQDDGEGQ